MNYFGDYFGSVPTNPGTGTGSGLTPEESALLTLIGSNVASIKGHFDAALEEGEQATILPSSPDPQKAIVRVRSADFSGVPHQNEEYTLTLKDKRPLTINGKILSANYIKGRTNEDGELDLAVWSDETLLANGHKPLYELKGRGIQTTFFIRVPPEGGIAVELKSDDEEPHTNDETP